MKTYSRVYAKIDLDAIAYNMEQMKQNIRPETKVMAVIKADGYGHGAVQIAEMMERWNYIWGFAVATLDEAVVLRTEGIQKPILVLGCVFPDQYMEMLKHEIRMNIYTEEMAESISRMAAREGKTAYMHIKLDTGMSRLGFGINEQSAETIKRISKMPNVNMEGIFTHFTKADEKDKSFTKKQIQEFVWMTERLKEKNVRFTYEHCSNSAGIIDVPEANFDIVRAGISTYGLYPSEEVDKTNVKLKPALALKSHVAFVKEIESGTPVSYGGTFVAKEKMKIATIPVGYADGYPRSLSNKGYVLIRGKKAPILGRVCMDQFMVDVTDIPEAEENDQVTLIGKDMRERITVEELADLSEGFHYEILCGIGKRVPRVYLRHGSVVGTKDYFNDVYQDFGYM